MKGADLSPAETKVANPPPRPLIVYDGECRFCCRWIGRWGQITGDRVDYAPAQEVGLHYPEIGPDRFRQSVQLIEPTGEVHSGARAVFRALARAPGRGGPLWLYEHVPGVPFVTERAYAFVSRHRSGFSTLTRLLWGHSLDPPTHRVSHWLLLRGIGLVYLVAFVSLWVQIDGLAGSRGIVPVDAWLERVASSLGPERYARPPTLCWLWNSDRALHVMCGLGTASAALLILGAIPAVTSVLCWVLYLSFFYGVELFLSFQWDLLLLEAGFLAILAAPIRLWSRPARDAAAPWLVQFLVLLLLFKLMFSSGVVKLTSGDATWHTLGALHYHYETQPLPPWTAWHAHRLPGWFDRASVVVMFIIELGFPVLMLGPRRLRHVAFTGFVALQVLIAATGNYGFFNLLSVLLCLPLLDDASWPRRFRHAIAGPPDQPPAAASRWRLLATWPFALVITLMGLVQIARATVPGLTWPGPIQKTCSVFAPFCVANEYGLFRSMTTTRDELIIEGSHDGQQWEAYVFKWKPGEVTRRPRFVAPHQPRLDWQMWFVPLSPHRQNAWFFRFIERLFENSPPVTELLERNPFPDRPPRYIRVLVYDYRFSDAATRRKTGAWWQRELRGLYCPVLIRRE